VIHDLILPIHILGALVVGYVALFAAKGGRLHKRGRVPEILYIPSLLPIPVLIPVVVMVFWLVRLRVKKTFRGIVGIAAARTSPAVE
jgi:hypothetical protein